MARPTGPPKCGRLSLQKRPDRSAERCVFVFAARRNLLRGFAPIKRTVQTCLGAARYGPLGCMWFGWPLCSGRPRCPCIVASDHPIYLATQALRHPPFRCNKKEVLMTKNEKTLYWRRQVADCQASGLSGRAYARRASISVSGLSYWRKRVAANPDPNEIWCVMCQGVGGGRSASSGRFGPSERW